MTPITPLLETPTGRLAELVHLLTDTSLSEAVSAITETTPHAVEDDDPWWVVASAIVELRHRTQATHQATQDVHRLRVPA